MESFGKLLQNLRGYTPLKEIAAITGFSVEYLAGVENGSVIVTQEEAWEIILKGFGLPEADVERLILGIQLYDIGLTDNTLRQIVIALIRKEAPRGAAGAIRKAYRDASRPPTQNSDKEGASPRRQKRSTKN